MQAIHTFLQYSGSGIMTSGAESWLIPGTGRKLVLRWRSGDLRRKPSQEYAWEDWDGGIPGDGDRDGPWTTRVEPAALPEEAPPDPGRRPGGFDWMRQETV